MKYAYLGSPGSYSHAAARGYSGVTSGLVGDNSFEGLFVKLSHGDVDACIVPVENSLAGLIYGNYDLLERYDVAIVGEQYIKIDHCLAVHPQVQDISLVRKVLSHSKALEQCTSILSKLPVTTQATSDTAAAAQMIAANGQSGEVAAIVSRSCAALYGLNIVQEDVADDVRNYTRFVVVRPRQHREAVAGKVSIIAQLAHTPGSLVQFLAAISQQGCNLTHIASRPIQGRPFEYRFYIDFTAQQPQEVVEAIRQHASLLIFLGSYEDKSAQYLQ